MNCAQLPQFFTAYADQELATGERAAFEAHLAQCPACRRELALFNATVSRLHKLTPVTPPANLLAGIHARLEAPATPLAKLRAWWQQFDFSLSLPATAVALTTALLLAILFKGEGVLPLLDQKAKTPSAGITAYRIDQTARASRLLIPATVGRAKSPAYAHDRHETAPVHPPAIALDPFQQPDVLMLVDGVPPETLSQLFRQLAEQPAWDATQAAAGLLVIDLPPADLMRLRAMLSPLPLAIAPPAAMSPHFGLERSRLRVAIQLR